MQAKTGEGKQGADPPGLDPREPAPMPQASALPLALCRFVAIIVVVVMGGRSPAAASVAPVEPKAAAVWIPPPPDSFGFIFWFQRSHIRYI